MDNYEHDNPDNWRWKVLYYNKKDTRLFPPKRYGLGWTINFANPLSVLAMMSLIAFIMLIAQHVIVPFLKNLH